MTHHYTPAIENSLRISGGTLADPRVETVPKAEKCVADPRRDAVIGATRPPPDSTSMEQDARLHMGLIECDYVRELHEALRERDDALCQSNHCLRLADRIFESTQDGIMIADINGTIEKVNPAFNRLTGYSRSEAIGRNASMLSSGRHPPDFYRNFWACLGEQGHWQGEIWNRRKDGELYLEYLSISSIYDEDGTRTHYAAIFSDITQRRVAEERLSYLATHDALTGLPNRMLFSERLNQSISRARRTSNRVAVMCVDLDRFKLINDTLGHGIGDETLKVIAGRMREAFPRSHGIGTFLDERAKPKKTAEAA